MDPNGIVRRVIAKPRDVILRNPSINHENLLDVPEFNFIYDDSDILQTEIAELYAYSEEPEFVWNANAYDTLFRAKHHGTDQWKDLSPLEKTDFMVYLLEQCEFVDRTRRCSALRAILYLMQGVFYQCSDVDEYFTNVKENILIFYSCDGIQTFIDLFNMELERLCHDNSLKMMNKNLSDNQDIRVIICVLYTVIEFARKLTDTGENWLHFKKLLKHDLSHRNDNDELFASTLFNSICVFCNAPPSPPLPIRKLLLLLWKLILFTLGGIEDAFEQKNIIRQKHNLSTIVENPSKVIQKMQPISPPLAGAEGLDMQQNESGGSSSRRAKRQSFTKQSALDADAEDSSNSNSSSSTLSTLTNSSASDDDGTMSLVPPSTPAISTDSVVDPTSTSPTLPDPATLFNKELPWLPKVRQKDLETFLDHTRKKFVGFSIKDDLDTLIGLPNPIHESVKILKQHLYISLSETQMQNEDEITKYPLSKKETVVPDIPAERLYHATLPQIPQFLIAMLKLLLTSTPTAKPKAESINILCDVIPEEMPITMVQTMKLAFDINRHKEMIVKAVSAILLLLLKHFKVNHIYQFEYICQNLVFSNCITVILKFFNHNILSHIQAKNTIPILDFPNCVIGHQPELTAEAFDVSDNENYCWRNMFSSINLLRILNKLTKGKHARTMSAPILRKTLRVKQAMMQLYALKLLKLQTRYLGRQWRKSNMMAISAIYQRVRHRLNDDWAYGNEQETQSWDFQTEERALRNKIDLFNHRRYRSSSNPNENKLQNSSTQNASVHQPPNDYHHAQMYDFDYFYSNNNNHDLLTALSSLNLDDNDLPETFKRNYEQWLEQEVYTQDIKWDLLMRPKTMVIY
ncbi:unnamed protein product [Didymodactylos carnosus]|uniref:Uncharacterized protein n=1 Tax=Didymodactylos carnosus TaxID=1234261 RepID=A0A814CWG8_9BILA|nr:unnamed protein product [Didymodactylos carnosus]CAF3723847.1 unnamed protein product [Didymodactylos carnosus]